MDTGLVAILILQNIRQIKENPDQSGRGVPTLRFRNVAKSLYETFELVFEPRYASAAIHQAAIITRPCRVRA